WGRQLKLAAAPEAGASAHLADGEINNGFSFGSGRTPLRFTWSAVRASVISLQAEPLVPISLYSASTLSLLFGKVFAFAFAFGEEHSISGCRQSGALRNWAFAPVIARDRASSRGKRFLIDDASVASQRVRLWRCSLLSSIRSCHRFGLLDRSAARCSSDSVIGPRSARSPGSGRPNMDNAARTAAAGSVRCIAIAYVGPFCRYLLASFLTVLRPLYYLGIRVRS